MPAPLPTAAGMKGSLRRRSSEPNGVTYCAAIIACARLADWRRALELKDQMLARGLPSQSIVYNSVLAACEASQQLEVALDVLGEMRVRRAGRGAACQGQLPAVLPRWSCALPSCTPGVLSSDVMCVPACRPRTSRVTATHTAHCCRPAPPT